MTRERALAWLEDRLEGVHPELADAVRRCAAASPAPDRSASVADFLADAATAELETLAEGPQDRAAAVRLLAADAVLTYAFEAAAGEGGDPPALARRIGPNGALGRALGRAARPEERSGKRPGERP